MEDVERVVLDVVGGVAREKSASIEPVEADQTLVDDLGLRSLDLARIIAKLELKLGADPFAEMVAVTSIRTVGDLCAAYLRCFEEDTIVEEEADADVSPGGHAGPDQAGTAPRAGGGLGSQKDLRKKARGEP
jgi:acyl carrier protein